MLVSLLTLCSALYLRYWNSTKSAPLTARTIRRTECRVDFVRRSGESTSLGARLVVPMMKCVAHRGGEEFGNRRRAFRRKKFLCFGRVLGV